MNDKVDKGFSLHFAHLHFAFLPSRKHFSLTSSHHQPFYLESISQITLKSSSKDIDKLGKAGDTVKVAPGYFRNHLMPKLLAFPNIDKFAYLLNEQRKIYQPTEEEKQEDLTVVKESKEDNMKEYERAALRLAKAKLVLRRLIDVQKAKSRESKADPLELHFAVTKDDLVAEVARQLCVNIAVDNLHLPSPLSTLGEYEVPLRLPRSIPLPEGKVNWSLKVKIRSK